MARPSFYLLWLLLGLWLGLWLGLLLRLIDLGLLRVGLLLLLGRIRLRLLLWLSLLLLRGIHEGVLGQCDGRKRKRESDEE